MSIEFIRRRATIASIKSMLQSRGFGEYMSVLGSKPVLIDDYLEHFYDFCEEHNRKIAAKRRRNPWKRPLGHSGRRRSAGQPVRLRGVSHEAH